MSIATGRRFDGRKVIVTGAGSGIGRAVARRFASEGADLLLVGRRMVPLEETASVIAADGGVAWLYRADVAEPGEVQGAVDQAISRWGSIDVLINNAGGGEGGPFLELSEEEWDTAQAGNLRSTFLMSQRVAREMVRRGSGVILHNASIDAQGGERGHASYNSAKAGVVALGRTMAIELADHGLRVNTVSPGWTYVDQYKSWAKPELLDYLQHSFARVPMKRLVASTEVAAAFAFLASDDASAITGIDLKVDCGLTANLYIQETWPEF